MFPKKGNIIPRRTRSAVAAPDYAEVISTALREELGGTRRAIKTTMKWTGVNEKTAKNWLAGTSGPRGEHLVSLLRHSDTVLRATLLSANRSRNVATYRIVEVRDALEQALRQIDELVNERTPIT